MILTARGASFRCVLMGTSKDEGFKRLNNQETYDREVLQMRNEKWKMRKEKISNEKRQVRNEKWETRNRLWINRKRSFLMSYQIKYQNELLLA